MADVEGIQPRAVTAWLCRHAGVEPPLHFELLPGGRSNLTVLVVDATGHRLVLRRPPLGNVLESAHDMGRERRILLALAATPVPVPEVVGYEEDAGIAGAPFLVMSHVDGAIVHDTAAAERHLDVPVRARVTDAVVDTLAALHAVDPDRVGLGEFGRRDGYVGRQLRRWWMQLERSGIRPHPLLAEVHRRLSAAVPDQADAGTIVHGDYRLDNLVVDPATGRVRAVLDWELATLGDPLADLGLLLVYWSWPDPDTRARMGFPSDAAGFPGRAHVLERYVGGTGRDVTDVDAYVAFGYWKLACILEGVHHRRRAGAYGTGAADPMGDAGLGSDREVVGRLAELAADAVRAAGR